MTIGIYSSKALKKFLHGRNGVYLSKVCGMNSLLIIFRTAEQAEGNKTVGVDPTVITACKVFSMYAAS